MAYYYSLGQTPEEIAALKQQVDKLSQETSKLEAEAKKLGETAKQPLLPSLPTSTIVPLPGQDTRPPEGTSWAFWGLMAGLGALALVYLVRQDRRI